jgi:hypothetical protein
VDPIIDLAPGAEDNALAVEIADRIRVNVAKDHRKAADFRALRASVLMVAEDLAESFTLRFDHGRLTVHDGGVGIPSVTFCGEANALRRLADFPLTRWLRLPALGAFTRAAREARETWRLLLGMLARGDLKVYGLTAHPRTVVLLLRVLSSPRA